MKYPTATRTDHQTFCENEGWVPVRDARGRTGTHHLTYKLALPDGRVLRTRVSHPADRTTYGDSMWAHILRDQLMVSEEVFWACVKGESVPDRDGKTQPAGTGLPAKMVYQLIHDCGIPESTVATMTKDQALAALNDFWSRPQ